ncbi:hypothetical protein PPYC1_11180 [Paenibacillus polymyxa]|nr:hypothetical protein PPYC1_11180 [Paenibacillus polymyxa]
MDVFLFILNILVTLLSIAGGALLLGTLYREYTLLGLLIAEKKIRTISRKPQSLLIVRLAEIVLR